MKKRSPLLALMFAFLACAMPALPADAQDTEALSLRPQWTQGQSARYAFWTTRQRETTMRFDSQTQEDTTTIQSEGEVTWTVDRARPDGSYLCTMTLDWMTADITDNDGETSTNDSRKRKGDVPFIHDLVRAMSGKPLKVTVNADGSVAKVEGVKAIRNAAEDPDSAPEALDFEETASDLASLVFAPETAEIGDDWDASFRWTHELGHLDQDWTFRVTGTEDIAGVPIAIVTGETTGLDLDPDTLIDEMPEDAPPVHVDLKKAKGQLRVLFDLTRSEAVGRESSLETTIDMNIALPNGGSFQRSIHETITSQTLRISEK